MDIRDRRTIHHTAAQSLDSAPGQPKKAMLVYAGISCLLSLLSAVLSLVLDSKIAGTGGLSNMGLRSILTTIQSILPIVQALVMACLGLGYHVAVLNMARQRSSGPKTLLEGFRRFGPLLRATILQALLYMGIGIIVMYASTYLFLLLPVSNDFYDVMAPLLSSVSVLDTGLTLDDATLTAAMNTMTPMLVIFAVLFLVIFLPFYYRYRMVMFSLADDSRPGALAALRESRQMMRGNRFALFKLDLSFWWYYLLEGIVAVVCYGDVLLPMLGVTLPWSGTVAYFVFYILSLALQLVLYYFAMNRVNVTYATAYEALRPKPKQNGVPLGNIFQM